MTPWRTNKVKLGRAECLFENMPDLNLDPDLDQSWIRKKRNHLGSRTLPSSQQVPGHRLPCPCKANILWEPAFAHWFFEAGSCFRLNSWGKCQCILYVQCTVQQWASVYSSMSVLWLRTVFPVSTIFHKEYAQRSKYLHSRIENLASFFCLAGFLLDC